MRLTRYLSMVAFPLVLAGAVAIGACSSDSGGGGGSAGAGGTAACQDACALQSFTCTVGGATSATAAVAQADSFGCSGTLTDGTAQPSFWIHCDTGQVCVENATECFAGTFTSTSFSYVIPSKGTTVTCVKK